MDLDSVIASLAETPYSLEVSDATLPTLSALMARSEVLQTRYENVYQRLGPMIRTDPDFRAYQTFHSNRLELQGPDLEVTQQLIEAFVVQGEPDDLRLFAAVQTVRRDQHLVDVLGQHQANILVERIALEFSDDRPFTESDLRSINAFCIQGKSFAGEYRTTDRLNLGQFFEDDDPLWFDRELDHPVEVKWYEIPDHMQAICHFISRAHECPPLAAAVAHAWFTHVHPFHDGNGRTARLIANLVLVRNNWPPITINKGKRDEYLDALSESDEAGDIRLLFELFTECLDLNLSEFEDEKFWRRRYKLELKQNNQQRINDWIEVAREFVGLIRVHLRQHGWTLERVSMPDAPTFLLLEEGEGRAATLFGKFRHPDRREIRVGIGYMSSLLRKCADFEVTIDGQHFPPTLYMTERDFRPECSFPYVHRNESALSVREFTFLPASATRAIYLYGRGAPTPQRGDLEGFCAALANDVATLEFPGYAARYGGADMPSGTATLSSSDSASHYGEFASTTDIERYGLNPEMIRAVNSLHGAASRTPGLTWIDLFRLLVACIDRGECFAESIEQDGVLVSKLGMVVRPIADRYPPVGPKPERVIDVVLHVLDTMDSHGLEVAASIGATPHPILVRRGQLLGRSHWTRRSHDEPG